MDVIEGNKLIYCFMNPEHIKDGVLGFKDWWWEEKKYHSSWDWLMPVVEKIENIQKDMFVIIHGESKLWECTIDNVEWVSDSLIFVQSKISKIDSTYRAVIQFIQWFNENNKK